MTQDDPMKIDYAQVLRQLQAELDGLDGRRQALTASIAGLKSLVSVDEQVQLFPAPGDQNGVTGNGQSSLGRLPAIPPGFFSGKTPTQGYRELMKQWPGDYRPPQIADMLLAGGMKAKTRTDLVQAIHSALKRERKRKARESARLF
jgi:hypothetical protein